jgi:hypothetical protein
MGGPGSGGARVRSGPARDPNAIRRKRDGDGGYELLPMSGREGEPPAWPLGGTMTKFQKATWPEIWRKPQAIMWERLSMEVLVASYVRMLEVVGKPKAPASAMANLLRLADNLGLSQGGLAKNRWQIVDEAPSAVRTPARPKTASAKDRIRVLEGGRDARAS